MLDSERMALHDAAAQRAAGEIERGLIYNGKFNDFLTPEMIRAIIVQNVKVAIANAVLAETVQT